MGTITSANATVFIAVAGLYVTPQQLQGFSADDIFSTEAIDTAETLMGVDGVLSAGFVFVPVKQTFMLQADSASNDIFDTWYASEIAAKEKFFASASIALPGIGKNWTCTQGVLSSFMPLPDVKKVLQPRKYVITWQSVSPAVAL